MLNILWAKIGQNRNHVYRTGREFDIGGFALSIVTEKKKRNKKKVNNKFNTK